MLKYIYLFPAASIFPTPVVFHLGDELYHRLLNRLHLFLEVLHGVGQFGVTHPKLLHHVPDIVRPHRVLELLPEGILVEVSNIGRERGREAKELKKEPVN